MKRAIAWFAGNPVAANLLMALIVGGGLITVGRIKQEVFPQINPGIISVTVAYPGAAPSESEQGICVRIEEAVQDLDGIDRIRSSAYEGRGVVTIELRADVEARDVLDDVKARIDAIDTFPEEAEKPVVQEVIRRRQVINIAVAGDVPETTLKRVAQDVREEIVTLEGISQAEVANDRPYEIHIEVAEASLRRHGLTLTDVAQAIRRSSLDLPGGSIKTEGGEFLLRTKGQAYSGRDFEALVLLTRADGTRVLLGDVAQVVDGFAQTDQASRFDGERAMLVQVFRVGNESALEVAEQVHAFVDDAALRMPLGITLTTWQDDSEVLRGRLDLLVRNGKLGLVLVFASLALFLRFRLAIWVALGIPIAFLGALWMLPIADVSINVISLFAFILVLGIVVDDAIVVGENIYRHHEAGKPPLEAAVDGAAEMAVPVVLAVLTTVVAFVPLLTIEGNMGQVLSVIPVVVIAALLFSLVESLFVLPAHLRDLPTRQRTASDASASGNRWNRMQYAFSDSMERFIERVYRPFLKLCLEWRYTVVAIGLAALLITGGLVKGGWLRFTFFPAVDADHVVALLTLPQGTPAEVTAAMALRLEQSARELRAQLEDGPTGSPAYRHMLTSVGEQPFLAEQRTHGKAGDGSSGGNIAEIAIELLPSEVRNVTSREVGNRWRELTGPIPDAETLSFTSSLFTAGDAIAVEFSAPDLDVLERAAEELQVALASYPGVYDVADSFRIGKREVELDILPQAEVLGLSLADLARQVRAAFYGEEAQRIQRGRDEIKVMVRYPERERSSLVFLEHMRIRTASGREVPFGEVAEATLGRGYAVIQRLDRRRVVSVTAQVDEDQTNAREVLAAIEAKVLPRILADHPGLRYSLEGERREERRTLGSMRRGFGVALFAIYGLLALAFRSYLQPFIVMSVIPFGLIGAAWGHLLMGMDLTLLSFFGIVALTGVVVNDSLVLVTWVNAERNRGQPLAEALRNATASRFRPIVLTSLTTFAGLTPMLLERSVQARFLIPVAISLGFGIVFATLITLVLVPVVYHLLEDARQFVGRAGPAPTGPGAITE